MIFMIPSAMILSTFEELSNNASMHRNFNEKHKNTHGTCTKKLRKFKKKESFLSYMCLFVDCGTFKKKAYKLCNIYKCASVFLHMYM